MSNLILSPNAIPVLSKTNAKNFHEEVKARIFETGDGLFEYLETIKFFAAIDKQISGDSTAKIQPDKEFIDYIREKINEYEGGKMTTQRGVVFQNAEVGHSNDFTACGDPVLNELQLKLDEYTKLVKERKEFLKSIPLSGVDILNEDELVKVFPPAKSSKSSFKVSLPK